MVNLVFGKKFLTSAKALDKSLKLKLKKSLDKLSAEPFAIELHTKPLIGQLKGLHSFRLGRDYRVIFRFVSPDSIQLLEIGHRKDIYR